MLLRNCVIGGTRTEPVRIDIVLLHRRFGVALLNVPPHLTPDAVGALRQRLEAARFTTAFPGYLPMAHLRLWRWNLQRLPDLLAEAFAGQPPISLPGGDSWMPEVRRILQEPARLPAPAAARTEPVASATPTWLLVPIAAGLALVSGLAALAWPRLNGPPPTSPPPEPAEIVAQSEHAPDPASPWLHPPAEQEPAEQEIAAAGQPTPPASAALPGGTAVATGDSARLDQAAAAVEPRADPPPAPDQPPANSQEAPPAGRGFPIVSLGPGDPPPAGTASPPPAGTPATANTGEDPPAAVAEHGAQAGAEAGTTAAREPQAPPPVTTVEPTPPGATTAAAAGTGPAPIESAPPAMPGRPELPPITAAAEPEKAAAPPVAEEARGEAAAPALPNPDPQQATPGTPKQVEAQPAPLASPMVTDGTAAGAAAAPPADAPPATAHDAGPVPPAADNAPAAAAPPATPPAPEPPAPSALAPPRPPSPDPARIAVLMRRGDALLALGDISGARRFYERAAEAGSAEAAMAAGRTHDPAALAAMGASGIRPDPDAAAAWYRRAEALRAAARDATPQHGAAR